MRIWEKLSFIDKKIIDKKILINIINEWTENYEIEDLVNLWYISVIKKWEIYYNNRIKSVKNPYIIWWAYMNFENYLFWGLDRYNKEWFTTQISNIFTIYNNQYSKDIEILWIKYKFKKVKTEFLYGKKSLNIDWYKISYMNKERLFLEYIREYIKYENSVFIDIYKELDKNRLEKMLKHYPIKQVILKVQAIEECI